jgi:hypothetical protein
LAPLAESYGRKGVKNVRGIPIMAVAELPQIPVQGITGELSHRIKSAGTMKLYTFCLS